MKPILILDSNQRSALSTVRSLGLQGVPVYTADETTSSLAGSSCFSQQYFTYPSPSKTPSKFIDFLAELVTKHKIDILLPMTELTTVLVLENQNVFKDVTLPFASLDNINKLSNKCSLMQMAESLNIPIPTTLYVDSPHEISQELDKFKYPVVLKPGKSWLLNKQNLWVHTAVRFADSASEVEKIFNSDISFHIHSFMVQECVEGEGQGVFAIYNNGEAVAFFSHRRIREKPPWGGVSVLSESISIDKHLLTYSKKLLDAANWHGIAMVEFKVSKNGSPYLMEINTRFWGSLQLAIDAGVDFPWMLYKISVGMPVELIKNYKTGIRLRWILGDLDSLYLSLKDKNLSLATKALTILRFIKPSTTRTRHEVNRWNDLGPFWFELRKYITAFFK